MRSRRVLMMTVAGYEPPETLEGLSDAEVHPIKTDFDVVSGLRGLGHTVEVVGIADSLEVLREAIREFKPHVVFNLLEHFGGKAALAPYVLGYLELIGVPYTGCNPIGMMFSSDKARQRKVLRHHRVPVPGFFTVARGNTPRRPKRLGFPLIVKSLTEHGSAGIAEASVVNSDEALGDRVRLVHEKLQTDAIVEEYIHGREVYMGVIGNRRLLTLPLWELTFENLRDGAPLIATERLKWDVRRQKETGIDIAKADVPPELEARIARSCKRAYRALEQNGYGRFDLRLADDGRFWIIESNPNPQLAFDEEFAESAAAAGIPYPELLTRILRAGLGARRA